MRGPIEWHKVLGRTMMACLGATIVVVLFATTAWAQCQLPSDAKKLSACKAGARDVTIGPSGGAQCTKVFVDQSFTGQTGFGKIVIEKGGTLIVPDQTVSIEVERFEVQGLLQAGTAACPIGTVRPTNQVTFTFTGSRPCEGNCPGNNKGIFVNAGGQLSLYGRKGTAKPEQSWTHLSSPSPVGDSSLDLADDIAAGPGAWQAGDWIVVGTTSFNPFETEFVRIQRPNKTPTGAKVNLLGHKFKHAHYGGPDPGDPGPGNFNAGADKNYGVDERAEVGLISRSIKLTAQISGDAPSRHWGGEIKVIKGFGKVAIQGVEIEKFGKDQLGSYPVHLHEIGPVGAGQILISSNSIHHSYNKCMTVHSTSNVTITNNVCARIVGHIFYQEVGDEYDVTYTRNLGLGAMSNSFEIYAPTDQKRQELIRNYFWAGDNLGQANSTDFNQYDGLMVPNTDKQDNPVHGSCFRPDPAPNPFTSNLVFSQPITTGLRRCPEGEYYVEPASGFWIINPGTTLIDNSIGGCQGVGRAYWYVPPGAVIDDTTYDAAKRRELELLQHKLLGPFKNNRGHACYAGLYAETEFGVTANVLNPRAGGVPGGQPVIAKFEQFTATRNRKRGVWLRPNWFVLSDARLATNAENVSLVTAGGIDGLAPGVWSLLEDSVIVGHSANNTGRFGPCPYPNGVFNDKPPGLGSKAGSLAGCIEQTPIPDGQTFRGGDVFLGGGGYPDPERFLIGYMIYDGPVRMFDNRFVNFKVDIKPGLTGADQQFLSDYSDKFRPHGENFIYEGDAALGWFTSNQSMYPVNTVGKGFSFTNVDLRHQIYTAAVNHGDFRDGDQNTAILDLDGSLSGFVLIDKTGTQSTTAFAMSLNNLPFNHAFNSVDECLAEGGQNKEFEGRPTALMTPGSMGTLGFEALFPKENPPDRHDQIIVFTKDTKDFAGTGFEEFSEMELRGRDGRGIWEPKLTSGYGYTVAAGTGIPTVVMVTPGDVVKPDISPSNPFYVRLGICYTSQDKSHPTSADQFTIRRGYRSYGGGGVPGFIDPILNKYWNRLDGRYNGEFCFDLNSGNAQNLDPDKGCPAHGVTAVPAGGCPLNIATEGKDVANLPICVYPTTTLAKADCIAGCPNPLTKAGGVPDLGKYFYDPSAGMLFFYVAQEFPNAVGPSPLGSCKEDGTGDASCPKFLSEEKETYYPCPPQGCITYRVTLNDSTYVPGPSTCDPYKDDKYAQKAPEPLFRLAYKETKNVVERNPTYGVGGKDKQFPHYTPATEPVCKK